MSKTPRRPLNPVDAAEALFKPVNKTITPVAVRPTIPNVREMVSLRLDSDVLAFFQDDGPGWQDRINDTLRRAMESRL